MTSAGVEGRPGAEEETNVGPVLLVETPRGGVQSSKYPVTRDQCLVPAQAHEAGQTQREECPAGPVSEPKPQERFKSEVEALEGRVPRPPASTGRSSHSLKRKPIKSDTEQPLGLPLQKEEPEETQSEPSPSAKQHKKAKKRKSLGVPALPGAVSTASTPSEILGLDRKAQRLRPLYQYINYCNPELNQDRDGEAQAKPESELALVSEEASMEQVHTLPPVAVELGSGLDLPCPQMIVPPTHILAPPVEDAQVEPEGLPSLGDSGWLKADVDKSTQADIDKMLSVCAAPLVPPLSPQSK
ncbi:uncharacterized protein C16orf86 homolog [Rhynchocyon petersi]